jgi:hypothetical protein
MKKPTAEMSDAKSEPTPGPWEVVRQWPGTGINGAWIKSGSLIVARIPLKADRPIHQKEADARLIAAAPALLEAARLAQFILNKMVVNPHPGESIAAMFAPAREAELKCRAAINLAEGL